MLVTKETKEENINNKLNVSRKVTTDIADGLDLMHERFIECIKDVDTSEVEQVEYTNNLISQVNEVIKSLAYNTGQNYKELSFINLTDEKGQLAKEYFLWVVGEFYLEKEEAKYYKRRIVRARTPKEAVYKYNKVDNSLATSVSCMGKYEKDEDYSQGIENEEVID